MAADRLNFLHDEQGFAEPEIEPAWDRVPAIARVRYRRSDITIEVSHILGFMGENHVDARSRHLHGDGRGDWLALARITTHTGYQLRRALDRQAQAIRSHLGLR